MQQESGGGMTRIEKQLRKRLSAQPNTPHQKSASRQEMPTSGMNDNKSSTP